MDDQESPCVLLVEFVRVNADGSTATMKFTIRSVDGQDEYALAVRASDLSKKLAPTGFLWKDTPKPTYTRGGSKQAAPEPKDNKLIVRKVEHFTWTKSDGLHHGLNVFGENGEKAAAFGRTIADSGLFGDWTKLPTKQEMVFTPPVGRGPIVIAHLEKRESGWSVTGFEG